MAVAMRQRGSTLGAALVDLMLVPAERVVPPTRHLVRAALELRYTEVTVDTAELVVSELVSNAIRHTAPGEVIRLRIETRPGGLLHIEVTDTDPNPPEYVIAGEDDVSGRGLFLIRAVAANFGWRPRSGGKALWVHLAYGRREEEEKPER